jgi:hypothetical protein
MDVEPVLLLGLQRQGGEEGLGLGVEHAARPGGGGGGIGRHAAAIGDRRLVMVAPQHHRAGRGKLHRPPDRPARVGAIAYDVAEQHQPLRPARGRVGQAGLQGLAVGVNVGEDGDTHAVTSVHGRRRGGRTLRRPPRRSEACPQAPG